MRNGLSCILIENERKGTTLVVMVVVEGGRDCLSSRYQAVARSAKSQLRLMSLPPLPNVIKLSSEAHYAAIEGTFYISLDFLYAQGRGECVPTQR